MEAVDYRKEWHNHVKNTRYGKRKQPQMPHKDAMKKASLTWSKHKAKLERAAKRHKKGTSAEEKTTG